MKQIDYKKILWNGLFRTQGLAMLTIGGMGLFYAFMPDVKEVSPLVSKLASTPMGVLGTGLSIEGLGDLITGKHHYVSEKIYNFIKGRNSK